MDACEDILQIEYRTSSAVLKAKDDKTGRASEGPPEKWSQCVIIDVGGERFRINRWKQQLY